MLYIVHCLDKKDVPGLRPKTRPAHLEHAHSLGNDLVMGGPLLAADQETPIGSMLLIEAPDRAALDAIVARDPYVVAGLFATITVTPFRIVSLHPPAA